MTGAVSTDTADHRKRFESVPLLAEMPPDVRNDLWSHARVRTAPAGRILISQGAATDRFHILLDGEATSVRVTSNGRSVSLARWLAPVVIDKVTMFAEPEHPGSVQADTAVTWSTLPVPVVRAALEASPSAQQHALSQLAAVASSTRHRFVDVAVRSSGSRLARWLVVSSDLGVPLEIPRPQDRLAQQLGMSRVTLNRALHRLTAQRVIELNGPAVVVLDRERLRQLADL